MKRIMLVSNRLPVTVEKRKGELRYHESIGGLATGLESFYSKNNGVWVGWPGITNEHISISDQRDIRERLSVKNCLPVFLTKENVDKYYNGFSNKTIWPLFHYFPQFTLFDTDLWNAYVKVNEIFAEYILDVYQPQDTIWIHDYQLMLLPSLVRKSRPEVTIGFFLHIPFPSFEIYRLLPWRKELIEGLIGADLIGFHTFEYIRHFLNSARRLLGIDHTFSQITYQNRMIKADVFPLGIDYEKFSKSTEKPEVKREEKLIRQKTGNTSLIIAIDRLDYTKGIVQRLEAFDLFLSHNPHMKEKVTMILVEVPSRTSVDSYRQLKRDVDELIGRINGKHGVIGWAPVLNLYRSIPFTTLVALYYSADVALVTPMRDGMNLVAKEYVATKGNRPGVLILSEMAGAAREMGEAILVNPNNCEELAMAIKTALEMPSDEQMCRLKNMQKRLMRYDVRRWASDFLTKLEQVEQQRLELQSECLRGARVEELLTQVKISRRTLILLDYDGTLVSIVDKPHKAVPDNNLIKVLKNLKNLDNTTVAIVSGRDRQTLHDWFNGTEIILCAEHGVWIKFPQKEWNVIEPLDNGWKDELRPVLELYNDRTPGSVLEEKDFSLAFHYRNADPELATIRVRELTEALIHQVSNLNLCVMEGKKVIEIKNAGIHKGTFAMKMIEKGEYDLIIAIGDDMTDEFLFKTLPDSAWTIKVGIGQSHAKYFIDSVDEVRALLERIGAKESFTVTS
ncbi:MAG: bifunctional alpha,alpha-trehalose-phosphate synthase (UDP-forming)/trehalose-phosphatase [Fibrobacter sp.]|nr:bifunctional alpha,alpha-trehalose-phosphate synthase (UDP-forming)/trehalose-phosphatase [Fibrobacter sp.]